MPPEAPRFCGRSHASAPPITLALSQVRLAFGKLWLGLGLLLECGGFAALSRGGAWLDDRLCTVHPAPLGVISAAYALVLLDRLYRE